MVPLRWEFYFLLIFCSVFSWLIHFLGANLFQNYTQLAAISLSSHSLPRNGCWCQFFNVHNPQFFVFPFRVWLILPLRKDTISPFFHYPISIASSLYFYHKGKYCENVRHFYIKKRILFYRHFAWLCLSHY